MTTADLRHILLDLFNAGIEAVKPAALIHSNLFFKGDRLSVCGDDYPLRPGQKIHVFGSGKASAGMALEVSKILGDRLAGEVIVSNIAVQMPGFTFIQGRHPVPDNKSIEAAEALQQTMSSLGPDDFYLFLLSGGSSALIEKPLPPLTLEEIQEVTKLMLKSNIEISGINTVRKHLSSIKGGRLSLTTEATGAVLVLSDVVGDDLAVIGSAPLYCDTSSFSDAKEILVKAEIWQEIPARAKEVIEAGCEGKITETPSTPSPSCRHYLVGTNRIALEAAAKRAKLEHGIPAKIITSYLQGDARQTAEFIAAIVREIRSSAHPFSPPVCLLFGGETTVQVHGTGKGGRNQELALAALAALGKDQRSAMLSCGSDGIDGNSHAAGAIVDNQALLESQHLGLEIAAYQKNNDATAFFEKVGSLVVTGPTGTNVMDLVFVLVL